MSPRKGLVLAIASAALLFGCGPGDGGDAVPEEAGDCPVQIGQDLTETRAVEIGDASSGELVPYPDGAEVELVLGNQGAIMITPWVRVEAKEGDGEEACFLVRLENEMEGALAEDQDALLSNQFNVRFVRDGASLLSDGALYHPFTWDRETLEGEMMKLTAIVRGDGFEGTKSVNVVLK